MCEELLSAAPAPKTRHGPSAALSVMFPQDIQQFNQRQTAGTRTSICCALLTPDTLAAVHNISKTAVGSALTPPAVLIVGGVQACVLYTHRGQLVCCDTESSPVSHRVVLSFAQN